MDDINTFKCYNVHNFLKNDKHYELLVENNYVRNGFSIFKRNDENGCDIVCSRGILKSCDIKSNTPYSSITYLYDYDFSKLENGSTVYICGNAIRDFVKHSNTIEKKIILVSGDCDETIPDDIFTDSEFKEFIESDKIIHWFSQNCVGKHPKLSGIPIGLDYHTMSNRNHEWGDRLSPFIQEKELYDIKNSSKPFYQRNIKCYSNFHFLMTTRYSYDRLDAINTIHNELVYYEQTKVKRYDSWKKQTEYAFVISPHGNGYDCHRTWEALCLGCIPIVKTSLIDYLYDDLPVLIVKEWSDVTYDLLDETVKLFQTKTFKYEKLTLTYWMNLINSYKIKN